MIKSMTGFGKAECALPNKKITVEIRSLNSKQLDLNLRMPSLYRQSECEVRNIVAKAAVRGKVDVFVTIENSVSETSSHINKEVFRQYLHEMNEALSFSGIDAHYDAIVPIIMRMPDVVAAQSEVVDDAEIEALLSTTRRAVAQLDLFRQQEGEVLIADLLKRVDLIESYKQEVIPFEKGRTETIKQRILDGFAQLKLEVDQNRLEQEMIYYLEKLDITEEKVRLTNHCKYFREVAASEDAVGRKLGFIAQEMGREINTLGSKSNESNMQILVVKMKDELEKIKEQVLNIL